MRSLAALLLLLVLALPALGRGDLEVIPLRHRSAELVIPALRPLLEPGGALSAAGDRVIVRASAANRAQIRRALAAIDAPLRRLMITVRHDNAEGGAGASARFEGRVDSHGGSSVDLRVYGTRGRADDRADQQVQVVEGVRAFVSVGTSIPVPMREVLVGPAGALVSESVVYRELTTGFYAQPIVSGERVTVEISPQQESLSTTVPGAVHAARLATTVSGRLGEWITLARTGGDGTREDGDAAAYSTRGSLERRRVLLKVDELR